MIFVATLSMMTNYRWAYHGTGKKGKKGKKDFFDPMTSAFSTATSGYNASNLPFSSLRKAIRPPQLLDNFSRCTR